MLNVDGTLGSSLGPRIRQAAAYGERRTFPKPHTPGLDFAVGSRATMQCGDTDAASVDGYRTLGYQLIDVAHL